MYHLRQTPSIFNTTTSNARVITFPLQEKKLNCYKIYIFLNSYWYISQHAVNVKVDAENVIISELNLYFYIRWGKFFYEVTNQHQTLPVPYIHEIPVFWGHIVFCGFFLVFFQADSEK